MIECYEECDADDFDCRQRCGRDQVNCSNGILLFYTNLLTPFEIAHAMHTVLMVVMDAITESVHVMSQF